MFENMFPAGFEPATLRVWSARDNHYTTETEDGMGKDRAVIVLITGAQWRNG